MVNILLASPTPPSNTTMAATAASNMTSVQVAVTDVPVTLNNLLRAIQTNAIPTGILDGNSLTLSTALGNITVALALQLAARENQNLAQQLINLVQTARPLTLTLQPGSPPTQGTLLIPTVPTTAQKAPPPASAFKSHLPNPQSLSVGNNLSAIVLSYSAKPTLPPTGGGQQTAVQGSATVVPTVIDNATFSTEKPIQPQPSTMSTVAQAVPSARPPLTVPEAYQQAALSEPIVRPDVAQHADAALRPPPIPYAQLPEQARPEQTYSVSTPAPTFSSKVADLLTQGNEVTLHIDAVLPDFSQAGLKARLPSLAPNQIFATVSGTGTSGQLILKAEDTTFFVKSQVSAPIGVSVIVSVEAAQSEPLVTLPKHTDIKFQALPQAIAALAEAFPQVFQQVMATHIPQPTNALPGALLFLFSAFKQGNVRGWLGDDATDKLIHSGQDGIITSLAKELKDAGMPARDPVVGEWQSYPIPLYAQQQLQNLMLYVHSDRDPTKDGDSASSASKKIRFLIDMRLSKLGAMQVDGFVQPKKLDMILRSETTLPEGLHHEIRTSYIKALGAVGYTGTLNFQVGRQHWTVMQKSAPQGIVT